MAETKIETTEKEVEQVKKEKTTKTTLKEEDAKQESTTEAKAEPKPKKQMVDKAEVMAILDRAGARMTRLLNCSISVPTREVRALIGGLKSDIGAL